MGTASSLPASPAAPAAPEPEAASSRFFFVLGPPCFRMAGSARAVGERGKWARLGRAGAPTLEEYSGSLSRSSQRAATRTGRTLPNNVHKHSSETTCRTPHVILTVACSPVLASSPCAMSQSDTVARLESRTGRKPTGLFPPARDKLPPARRLASSAAAHSHRSRRRCHRSQSPHCRRDPVWAAHVHRQRSPVATGSLPRPPQPRRSQRRPRQTEAAQC